MACHRAKVHVLTGGGLRRAVLPVPAQHGPAAIAQRINNG